MYETEKMVLNISENALLEFEKNFTEVIFLANVGIVNTTAKSQEDTRQSPDALQSDGNAQSSVPMQQVADAINLFVPPVLFAVGLVANVLVIMVMQSKDFRQISTSFYMCISSIVDMVSLGISLPAHFLYVNFPDTFEPVRDAHALCSFFNLFGWGSSDMGVLLTVAMTTERSLAIQFPLRAPTLCTVKRAKTVTVGLFVLEFLKVGHLIFTSKVAGENQTSVLCVVDVTSNPSYGTFYRDYWPYVHNVFLLVCFIAIIIGNVIITVYVKRSEESKDIGDGVKTAGGGGRSSVKGGGTKKIRKIASKSRQICIMLIIDSATIVVCTLPFSVYVLINDVFQLFEDTPEGRALSSLTFAVVFYLLYVNRCANFFLYCVSGERFRQTLKDIFTSKNARHRKKQNILSKMSNPRNIISSTTNLSTIGNNDSFSSVEIHKIDTDSKTLSCKKEIPINRLAVCMNPAGPTIDAKPKSKMERQLGIDDNIYRK